MKPAIALRLFPNRSGRFCVIPKASVSYSILSYYALWFAQEWYYFEQDIDKAKTNFEKATSFFWNPEISSFLEAQTIFC